MAIADQGATTIDSDSPDGEHPPPALDLRAPHAARLDGWVVVVLAAGRGERMHSSTPKVLHPVAGRPMVRLVCDAVREAGFDALVVVVADPDGAVTRSVRAQQATPPARIATQLEPLGTGDAALAARARRRARRRGCWSSTPICR